MLEVVPVIGSAGARLLLRSGAERAVLCCPDPARRQDENREGRLCRTASPTAMGEAGRGPDPLPLDD